MPTTPLYISTLYKSSNRYFRASALEKKSTHERELLNVIAHFFHDFKQQLHGELKPQEIINRIVGHENWPWLDKTMIHSTVVENEGEETTPVLSKTQIQFLLWKNAQLILVKLDRPLRLPLGVFNFMAICLIDLFECKGYQLSAPGLKQRRGLQLIESLTQPFVMIEESGELVTSNLPFARLRLLPRDCLKFKDESKIEILGDIYLIKKNIFEYKSGRYHIIVFIGQKSLAINLEKEDTTISDLGIITSSIAHELNNPLAGILASIQVLNLDDQMKREYSVHLSEMEKSAKKCKELVKIFLGFSKDGPAEEEKLTFLQCFEHAIGLSRSRMMENQLVMTLEKNVLKALTISPKRSSGMVMAFYLLLSEIMTCLSQNTLLDWSSNKKTKHVHITLIENAENVMLEFRPMPFGLKLDQALFLHLLALQNLKLSVAGDRILLGR